MRKEPADFKDIAIQNEKLVISLLRRHGAMSQTQLRKYSAMSVSTSSYIIARLRNKGYLLENKGVSEKRGAKPVILEINSKGCFAIGMEVRPDSIYAGLFDFNAVMAGEAKTPLSDTKLHTVCAAVKAAAEELLELYPFAAGKLSGIGIAISGSVKNNSVVVLSSPMGWKNVPFKANLECLGDVPVMIYPTQVRMLAEVDIDAPQKNVLYVNIGNGVGGHIIVDGHLSNGATGRSCEIGHIVMEPGGRQCGCGNFGCLETIISGIAIAAKIKADLKNGRKSILTSLIKPEDVPETVIAAWGDALKSEDRYSIELAGYAAGYLSRAVSIAVNICDPEIIMLAGYVAENCFEYLAASLKEAFASNVYNYGDRNIVISKATSGKRALITGAAISVMQ